MGLNLRKIGKKLTDFGSRAYDQANIFDSGRSYQTRTPSVEASQRSVLQQAPTVARTAIRYSPLGVTGKVFSAAGSALPKAPTSNAFGRGVNTFVVDPFKETLPRVGGAMQGENVYHGSLRQQAGQVLEDQINLASLLPVGKAAQVVGRGGKLTVNAVKQGAKTGSKVGAGFGAAQGASTSLQNEMGLKDAAINTALSTGIGTVAGGTLGAAIPVANKKIQLTIKGIKSTAPEIRPVYADYQPTKPNTTPETPDVSKIMSTAAEAERTKYKVSKATELRNKATSTLDPYSELVKIDKQYAKSQGIKYRDLPAKDRLDYLADTSAYSARQADQMLSTPTKTGESVSKVIQRYGESTPQGKDFNNYLNARFALEVFEKRGRKITNASTEDLAAFVKSYELQNPRAAKDAATIKAHADNLLDEAANGGLISKADADFVKSYYQNYTPLNRVFSENLARPEIGGRAIGSIGRQKVLQNLEGSQLPLDDSFSAIVSRTNTAVSQANRARLAKAYLDRAQKGVAPGELLVGAGNKAARKNLRSDIQTVNKSSEILRKKISITNRQARKIQSTLDKLNKKGVELSTKRERPVVLGKLADPGAVMSKSEFKNLLENLVNQTPASIRQVQKSIAIREPKLAAKLDDVLRYKQSIGENKVLKQELKSNIAQLQDDPTTGKQVISGLVDGEPFKLEVPPEITKVLQGLDERKFDAVTQGMAKGMRVLQTAWTGFLNPVFSGVSFVFYDTPMSIINSKVGFKTLGARAIVESLKSVNSNSEFQKALARSGAQLVGGSQLGQNAVKSAEAIAARKNIYSKIKFNSTNPKELLQSLDVLGGKLANSTRTRVAKATYLEARKTMSEADALKEAAYAYNNVLPNYGRTSHLVRGLNAYIPYAGASVAGTRALGTALVNNPAASAKLLAVGIAPMIGTAAYSLSTPEGQEFVNDMLDSKKSYLLDNNLVIVLPGASKNKETGEWSGIIKLPISPELRALNRLAWRETNKVVNGQNNASPTTIATSLFDFATGGLRTSENPFVQTAEVLAGKDPRSGLVGGQDLIKGDLAEKPKSEQAYSTTSSAAKNFSKLVGGAISPIQADAILGQFSTAGQLVQNKGGNPVVTLKDSVSNRFVGAYGKKDSTKFFEKLDSITKNISDVDDRKSFVALHSKDPNPGILDSAEKATIYLNRPEVVKAERKLDEFNRKQGKVGNPLFDLSDDQLQKVLAYRSAKMLNSGKQTYDKNGNPLFTSLGLDEPWYDKFRSKETLFYSSLKTSVGDGTQQTFSGAKKPSASPELQKKLDYYYTLKSGTGERSRFLRANPDVLAYWETSDGFTNKERAAIGLEPIDEGSTKNSGFSYGSGKSSNYGTSNPLKYAISLKTGGAIAKPKVSVKKSGTAKGGKTAKRAAPKVSIKKSLV